MSTPQRRTALTEGARPGERQFYMGMGLLMLLLTVAGFGPSIANQSNRNSAPTALVTAHGIVVVAWILLFLTEAALVATRRTAAHRRLGLIGSMSAPAVIILGYFVVLGFARRGYDLSGDVVRAVSRTGFRLRDPAGLLFPLSELLVFGILVAGALWWRERREAHKRLMLLATLSLATEPMLHLVGHLTMHWPALRGAGGRISGLTTVLLLSAGAIHDRAYNGRIHPVSLWTPIVVFAWLNVLAFFILPSVLWREIARRMIH